MKYLVNNIQYDTDGETIELPNEIEIEVCDTMSVDEKLDFISDEISNRTGFCHGGFCTIPSLI